MCCSVLTPNPTAMINARVRDETTDPDMVEKAANRDVGNIYRAWTLGLAGSGHAVDPPVRRTLVPEISHINTYVPPSSNPARPPTVCDDDGCVLTIHPLFHASHNAPCFHIILDKGRS